MRYAGLIELDGGGVRGLCSLLVLDKLMQEIKGLERDNRPDSADLPKLPCRYFDLCGGTSTGGYFLAPLLIIRYTVADCVDLLLSFFSGL